MLAIYSATQCAGISTHTHTHTHTLRDIVPAVILHYIQILYTWTQTQTHTHTNTDAHTDILLANILYFDTLIDIQICKLTHLPTCFV